MLLDLEDSQVAGPLEEDVVIIGGGAVGLSMLADRVRRGERTLLIEAGGAGLENRSQDIVRSARSTGQLHEGVHIGRFRLLGGTTHFWGGQLGRFDPIVFEPRAQCDGLGWPFTRADVDPWYDAANTLLGMDAAISDDAGVCAKAGAQLADDPGLDYFFTRWLKEPSLAVHYAQDIASPLATVLLHANFVGFAPLPDGRHEAVVRTLGGKEVRVRARAFVLACGTFEIVRMLQQPYVSGEAAPWNANPWLGRGYYDHIDVIVGTVRVADRKRFDSLFENVFLGGYKYNPKLKLSEAVQRRDGLLQACGAFIFSTSYKENAENLRHFMRSLRRGKLPANWRELPRHFIGVARVALPMVVRYLRSNRAFHPRNAAIQLRVTTEQVPVAQSAITRGDERDALGLPVLSLNWTVDGREIETVAACAENIRDLLAREGIATVDLDARITARDAALLEEGDDTNHQMGGARIGADPATGVVDPDLKVFGTDDVYVAGAAVFPTSGFVNCTFTAIALALRLNQKLRAAHG